MREPSTEPAEVVRRMASFMLPLTIRAVAQAGVADALTGGPRPVAEVAHDVGLDPDALARALRALAQYGIFDEAEPGIYRHTPLSDPLRRDHPSRLAPSLALPEWEVHAWADISYSLRTGEPAFPRHYRRPYFDWLGEHEEANRRFDAFMKVQLERFLAVAMPRYDWPEEGTIVDVGGGTGALLAAVLGPRPALRGILFEQPAVASAAAAALEETGLADRCQVVEGDFFQAVPPGGDLYVLARVLHDWSDERAAAILRSCRAAMPARAKLLVFDGCIRPGRDYDPLKFVDLHMLVLVGGKERDESQWRELLASAGLRLERVVPTPFQAWIEALPAG